MKKRNDQINIALDNEEWSMVIKPYRSLFEINLKEIWQYRDLIFLFIRRDFVARYKQTVLGPLWFIIQPLLTTILFTVVFGRIANISTDGLPQFLFYMSGVVGWTYFSHSLTSTAGTFRTNAKIFGKVYFPRLTVPISIVISNLITFGIQLLLLTGFMIYFYYQGKEFSPNEYLLLLPFLVLLLAGLGLGFGIIISSLTTKYRDLSVLVTFGVQLWMYVTPIVYPLSELPEKYRIFILANPLSPIIETFRYALLGAGTVDFYNLLYSLVFTIVVLTIGILIFNRVERVFMDTV